MTKILIDEEQLRQWKYALETRGVSMHADDVVVVEAIQDMEFALNAVEKVEPVAWVKLNDESDFTFQKPVHEEGYQKLYAASIESKHWEITAKQLGKQLAECERERDYWKGVAESECDAKNELHQVCRDAYEVWAGSEGIPEPVYASEAYLYQLLINMRDEVKRGVAKVGAGGTGEK